MTPLTLQRIAYKLNKLHLGLLAKLINTANNLIFSCDIKYTTYIPKSTIIDHYGHGVVIHSDTVLGEHVRILHNVTLGGGRNDARKGAPRICEGVLIGAGACVLGPVEIGKFSKIGANAVVISDVPEYSTAVGIPAKIVNNIKYKTNEKV